MLDDKEKARLLLDLRTQRRMTWAHFEKMSERREFIEWIRRNAPQPVVAVSFFGEGDPWARIVAAARTAGTVIVSGDELLWGEARDAWRRVLNLGRDAISDLHAPVVVLADAALLDEIAQRAPDLWSWRGQVIEGDYQSWNVQLGEQRRPQRATEDPLWASILQRPDLYAPPKADSPFQTLLRTLPAQLTPRGVQVTAVRGAGGYSLLVRLAQEMGPAYLPIYMFGGPSTDGDGLMMLSFLGKLSRTNPGSAIADRVDMLGRELRVLLGQQYADLAKGIFDGQHIHHGASRRLEERCASQAVRGTIEGALDECVASIAEKGITVIVLAYARMAYDASRLHAGITCLRAHKLPICAVITRDHGLVEASPRLDATIEDAVADAVLSRRFPWLPSPLRQRVVRWSDGLPGMAMSLMQRLTEPPRTQIPVLTRADVDQAASHVAEGLSAGPEHERLVAHGGATGVARDKIDEHWREGFVRFPRDGTAPYFHPLWLRALGREPDPDGSRTLVPSGVFAPPSGNEALLALARNRRRRS